MEDILDWLETDDFPVLGVKSASTSDIQVETVRDLPAGEIHRGTTFEIDRDVLLYLLDRASATLPKGASIIPVLENFQFKLTADSLTVVSSSMEMATCISTKNINVITPGIELFPARKILAMVKESDNGKVFVEVTSQGAAWVIGNAAWEIKQPKSRDFPKPEDLDEVKFYPVDRQAFIEAISKVRYAVAKDQFRHQLKQINVKAGKFLGFDGLRFQMAFIRDFKKSLQIPTAAIDVLLKTLRASSQETILVGDTPKRIVFKLDNEVLYISKHESQYPNVETLILRPTLSNDIPLTVNKKALKDAIRQARITADGELNTIGLSLSKNSLEVVAKDLAGDSSKVKVEAVYSGKKRTLVVNHQHLVDLISHYDNDECTFLLGEDSKNRKSTLLLKDEDSGAIGFISQLHASMQKY